MAAAVTKHTGIDLAEAVRLSDAILSAWNEQDVETVLSCYTEDCVYLDPNTRGPVVGREALRCYHTKLSARWPRPGPRREAFEERGVLRPDGAVRRLTVRQAGIGILGT